MPTIFRNKKDRDERLKAQFKEVVRMVKVIEEIACDSDPGLPTESLRQYAATLRLNNRGMELLASLLLQSDRVELTEDRMWLTRRTSTDLDLPSGGFIDV